MSALYAVIVGRPVIWQVVGWDGTKPLMVPLGRFVPEYRPEPVPMGRAQSVPRGSSVVYAPDIESLVETVANEVDDDDE